MTSQWTIDDRPESDWLFIQRHGVDVAQLPRFDGQRELANLIVQLLQATDDLGRDLVRALVEASERPVSEAPQAPADVRRKGRETSDGR